MISFPGGHQVPDSYRKYIHIISVKNQKLSFGFTIQLLPKCVPSTTGKPIMGTLTIIVPLNVDIEKL